MSYKEAIEDGIPVRRMPNGTSAYAPPCVICGQPSFSFNYMRGHRYTCRECKAKAGISRILKNSSQEITSLQKDIT